MAGTTEAIGNTLCNVSRAAPGRGSPACVPSSVNTPVAVEDSSARESETREDNILAALAGVTERLAVLESSQRERDEDERMMGAVESDVFASKLGANMRCVTDYDRHAWAARRKSKTLAHTRARRVPICVARATTCAPAVTDHTPMHAAPPPQQSAPPQA